MMDLGPPPFEAGRIEIWICKQLGEGLTAEYVADELLKKWDALHLSVDGKAIVSRFCLLNNFAPSLFRVLKTDLRSGTPLPWPQVLELLYRGSQTGSPNISKAVSDAIMTGATRDKQLHGLSGVALSHGEKDPRWRNILDTEIREKLSAIADERRRLFQEIQIFKTERMDAEVAQALTRILTLFPDDQEAKTLLEKLGEKDLEERLDKLRNIYGKKSFKSSIPARSENDKWPELEAEISKLQNNLDFEQSYLLSISLYQMEFFPKALEVLRVHRGQWKIREKLWEIELLLAQDFFAEALNCAQIVLSENLTESSVVKPALYYSAKAYRGLGDTEQARSIIEGLLESDPHFKDARILIVEWEQ